MANLKLIKDAQVVQVHESTLITSATVHYNNGAGGATSGIDAQGFSDAILIVNAGSATGDGSVAVAVYESTSADAAATMTAISGASTTTIVSGTAAQSLRLGSLLTWQQKRYLFVKFTKTGTGGVAFGASMILNRAAGVPVEQNTSSVSVDFELATVI